MNYFIIIRGALGVGKTSIAKGLAKKLNGNCISIDKILEKNRLDKIKGKCIPKRNFIEADKIILPKVKKYLHNGKVVIFDGNFYHKKQIEHLIKNLKYKHFIFTLKARLLVCIERDSKRKRTYGKKAAKAVHNLVSKFDYGTIINTDNKTEKDVIKEILIFLKD